MLRTLRTQLTDGKTSEATSKGLRIEENGRVTPSNLPSADLVFTRGRSRARIEVTLGRFPSGTDASYFIRCPDSAFHPHSKCTSRESADGALQVVDQSPKDEGEPSGEQRWVVQLISSGSHQVTLIEEDVSSTARDKLPPAPFPLNLKRLESIAAMPEWMELADKIPVSPSTFPSPPDSSITEKITDNLSKLIPDEMRITGKGGERDFAHIAADDGLGPSLVTVNVQKWNPEGAPLKRSFAKIPALPDGTRVRTGSAHPAAGGPGTTERVADAYRKNGFRVVVTSLDAPTYAVPATRRNPALTISQLKDITLSGTWDDLIDVAPKMN